MFIYPAIDLYNGVCVRLKKGDFKEKTVYSATPVEMAKAFMAAGATKLHVVDLNGAESDNNKNFEVVCEIVKAVDMEVQVGGGIRSLRAAEKYLSAGVNQIIIGTVAVEQPELLKELVEKFGQKIVVAVDIKNGYVAINGWKDQSTLEVMDFIQSLEVIGVGRILCTDISRDGLLQGSNQSLYKAISKVSGLELIASGGVASLEEIKALQEEGLYGAIIGKALYEKRFTLEEALSC